MGGLKMQEPLLDCVSRATVMVWACVIRPLSVHPSVRPLMHAGFLETAACIQAKLIGSYICHISRLFFVFFCQIKCYSTEIFAN